MSLNVENLAVSFATEAGSIRAVDGVDFRLEDGKTLAIVGESGCGKSVTAFSIMGLLPPNGQVDRGRIEFLGQDLVQMSPNERRKLRGNQLGMIFQEPMTALNPVYTIGRQVAEVFRIHRRMNHRQAWEAAVEMLDKVRIPDPRRRAEEYPFQMSGGMRQRVLIAIALACNPKILIADEPTTALDVTIQAQILELMKDLQRDMGTSILLITHDLGVVAETADDVIVMYCGKTIEKGTVYEIFDQPSHPYTQALLRSIPKPGSHKGETLTTIEGVVPNLLNLPSGCRFHDRCPRRAEICSKTDPQLRPISSDNHKAACHFAGESHS